MGGRSLSASAAGVARSPLGPLIWSSRSQTTAGIRRSVERGDGKKVGRKVCAQLALSIPLILGGYACVRSAVDRKSARAPGHRGPYSLIFLAQGVAGPPCSRTTRTATVVEGRLHSQHGDDAAHDVEISERQGSHGSVAQHDLSPDLPRHVSRPRVPRGPSRGLDRGRGERVAHREDRATLADSRPRNGGSSHDPFQNGGLSMTPRHTTPAPVAYGDVRALAHGRGRGRTAAEQTAGAPRPERRTVAVEDGTGRGDAHPVPNSSSAACHNAELVMMKNSRHSSMRSGPAPDL